ncbi:MAG: tRNA (N(6)-L-threonylcarbamoyladenosine(37)-C(2))-methylthiotransferase MtaB [Bdellovibrionia bacterium]
MSRSKYILKTLGCKANLYDSQVLEKELKERGWAPENSSPLARDGGADLVIINSCTVTNEADRQTRKLASQLARENPQASVVVTGCGAEVDPQGLLQVPGVQWVVGNQDKTRLVDLVQSKIDSHILNTSPSHPEILGGVQNYSEILSRHPMDRPWPSAVESFSPPPTYSTQSDHGFVDKTRAFVKIQEGCNSFCTYCIIPYGRGPSRSLDPDRLIQQIQNLVDQGVKEVILTGTNLGDYGSSEAGITQGTESLASNKTEKLLKLIEAILEKTPLARLRLSSLDPGEITSELTDFMAENPRLCPHFHVSLQSPHSRILKLMKRNYRFEEVEECLLRISKIPAPVGGVFVGMDVITGFPGETKEEFDWTLKALESLPWSRLHVFPYSERNGTPATRLPHPVRPEERVRRARALNELSLERQKQNAKTIIAHCQAHGLQLENILMEKPSLGSSETQGQTRKVWVSGLTPNYLRVLVQGQKIPQRNQLVSAQPIDLMIDSKAKDVAFVVDQLAETEPADRL